MTARDDDALRWEGDDDPAPDAPSPTALPQGFTAVGRGREDVGRLHDDGTVTMPGERRPLGTAALITLGVLGGIYLLWSIGWIAGGLRLRGVAQFLVSDAAYAPSVWLAALAPALWFLTAVLLTRTGRTWQRMLWLFAGAVLFIPWPFVMVGAVGQ